MFSINSFRVRNLRSILDSGYIKIKPITILVGRNSSGKSTIARILPLLRQSVEASKRGPLLWWGRLVDFGGFEESINRSAKDDVIGLDFKINFELDDLRKTARRGLGRLSLFRSLYDGEIDVSINFKSTTKNTYTSDVEIKLFDFKCRVFFEDDGHVISITCGSYIWKPTEKEICYATQDRLVPSHIFFKVSEKDPADGKNGIQWESHDPLQPELERVLSLLVHGNTARSRIRHLATKIPIGFKEDIFKTLSSIGDPPSFRDNLSVVGSKSPTFQNLCDMAFVSNLDILLDQINTALSNFSKEVVYLEPLRATAQRYYRQQALAVDEIDSKGENIAMYLDSLAPAKLLDFNLWLSANFGIKVDAKKIGGHISINITQEGGVGRNIADMGFGFSQMLPIATQLWAASSTFSQGVPNRSTIKNPVIVIEQPELHLHPEYQARIANIFVAAVKKRTEAAKSITQRGSLSIIAETHSPAIINRLGELISENIISQDDVQIILLSQENTNMPSQVITSKFNSDGVLVNWPAGFFEPI